MKHLHYSLALVLIACVSCAVRKATPHQTGQSVEESKIVVDEASGKRTIESQRLVLFERKRPRTLLSLIFTGFPAREWQTEQSEFKMELILGYTPWWLGQKCYITIDNTSITVPLEAEKIVTEEGNTISVRYDFSQRFKEDDDLIRLLAKAQTAQISLEVCNSSPPYLIDTQENYSKRDALAIGLETFTVKRTGFGYRKREIAEGTINENGDMIVHTFASGSEIGGRGLRLTPPYQIWGQTKHHEIPTEVILKLQKIIKLTKDFKTEDSEQGQAN